MVAVIVGVDEKTYGLLRHSGNCRLEFVVHLRELAVDHNDAVFADGDCRIAAEALQQISAVAEIEGLDRDFRPVRSDGWARRLLRESGRDKTGRSDNGDKRDLSHTFLP